MYNSKARHVHIAFINAPWGSEEVELSDVQAAQFNKDPDAWVAKHHEMTREDYVEWMDLHGTPLCGGTTKAGKPCKQTVGGGQMSAEAWKKAHRERYCSTHGG